MAEVKIQFKAGAIEFSCEGSDADKDWLAAQLDKILLQAPKLATAFPEPAITSENGANGEVAPPAIGADPEIAKKHLATFLNEKGAPKGWKRFLTVAVWLEARGQGLISTNDVIQALSDNKQTEIKNPYMAYKLLMSKGFIQKKGDQFFVTPEGKAAL